jgi:hypothetical protein
MRSSITLYEDQYQFYKELKSKRLLIAFVEYMFEDIEPTWLNKIEKVVRNSLKIRMENQKKKSDAWKQSHWGWRKKKESNASSELDSKNNTTNNKKTTQQTTKKQEVKDNNTNVLLLEDRFISKDINVDESTEQKSDNEMLYESYPFKWKWIDKQVCDKLIAKQIQQWATIKWMLKEMELEKLELRINQWLSYRYWKKFETWIKEYVEWMADSEDRLRKLLVEHRKRLENWPNYKKNPRDEICDLFGADYVKKLFVETKQGIKLFTT